MKISPHTDGTTRHENGYLFSFLLRFVSFVIRIEEKEGSAMSRYTQL